MIGSVSTRPLQRYRPFARPFAQPGNGGWLGKRRGWQDSSGGECGGGESAGAGSSWAGSTGDCGLAGELEANK